MTIHNVFTFYESEDGEKAMVSFFRPQDWGDPTAWQYLATSIWVPNDDRNFRSRNCHIWCHPRHDRWEFLREIGGTLFWFPYPGSPGELCDRSHLGQDDFWLEEWGEMPPYYDGDDFDPFDDSPPEMDLVEALNDPNLIPMALTPAYATIVASLMQLGLRHPGVRSETRHLYQVGRPFVETLIDRIVAKSPEYADRIRHAFAQGWDESQDVTTEEFDASWRDLFPKSDPNN